MSEGIIDKYSGQFNLKLTRLALVISLPVEETLSMFELTSSETY